MVDTVFLWKIAQVLIGMLTCGVGWWIRDLHEKIKKNSFKTETLNDKLSTQGERIAKLESEAVTEAEVLRMLSEMERRIMGNFKDFRHEFNGDLKAFREDLREDLKDLKYRRD